MRIDHKQLNEIARKVCDVVFQDRVSVLWIGAGISAPAYPKWKTSVTTICDRCGIDYSDVTDFTTSELKRLAQESQNKDRAKYEEALAGIFGERNFTPREANHLAFDVKPSSIVTTNFDQTLEKVANSISSRQVFTYPDLNILQFNSHGGPHLYYIHGKATDSAGQPSGKDLIFSENDFQKAYDSETPIVSQFINQVFMNSPVLFLGFNLKEEYVSELLMNINRTFEKFPSLKQKFSERRKVILLPNEVNLTDNDKEKECLKYEMKKTESAMDLMGVEVVWFDTTNSAEQFEIELILEKIRDLRFGKHAPSPGIIISNGEELK